MRFGTERSSCIAERRHYETLNNSCFLREKKMAFGKRSSKESKTWFEKNKHKNKTSPENSSMTTTLLSTPGIWVCDLLLLSHCQAVVVHGNRPVCFSGSIPCEPQVTREQLLKYFRYNLWSYGGKSWKHDFLKYIYFFQIFTSLRINIYQSLALKSLLTKFKPKEKC